jgi:hypothetical protein
MPLSITIRDESGEIATIDDTKGEVSALTVATRSLKVMDNSIKSFQNDTFGADMNQNVAFSGTPDNVHDGIDKTQWTASAISGTWTFNQANTHAWDATVTIVDFNNIAGDTVTITVNGTADVLTEGADWNAGASNAAAATSLASAIDALANVSASATAAVVTALADTSADDIEALATSDAVNITVSARAIDATATGNASTAQLLRGSSIDLSSYTTLTGRIYLTGWQAIGVKDVEIVGWDSGAGTSVGNSVNLGDYIDTTTLNVWHGFAIVLEDMGLNDESIDAFRITTISNGGGQAPDYYLDYIQVQQTGSPLEYKVEPDAGTWLHVKEFNIVMADAYTGITTVAGDTENATFQNLSYDKILGVTSLPNGIVYQRVKDGEVIFSAVIHQLSDFFLLPGTELAASGSDGTNTFLTLRVRMSEPFIMKAEEEDKISLTVSDDLSGLLFFQATAGSAVEQR